MGANPNRISSVVTAVPERAARDRDCTELQARDGDRVIKLEMTLDELLALPVSVDLVTAGRAFALGRTKSFELAQAGDFPCAVRLVGGRYRVPRSALLEALGVDPATARNATGEVA